MGYNKQISSSNTKKYEGRFLIRIQVLTITLTTKGDHPLKYKSDLQYYYKESYEKNKLVQIENVMRN